MQLNRFNPEHHLKATISDVDDPLSHVFYVLSWGYGADHWYAWIVKALNAHPEVLTYLANEGSRPKYFPEERSRAHRPDPVRFSRFLADIGMTYTAIGDCYSYRCPMMDVIHENFGNAVRMIELVRNPYAFLHFHVRWRERNMRMFDNENAPLEHEWNAADHVLFKDLGLKEYDKNDINIWSLYQGMLHLNTIIPDAKSNIPLQPLEEVVKSPDLFKAIASYISHGRITYSDDLIDTIYSWVYTPFRGEEKLNTAPEKMVDEWPDWKHEAMHKLVHPDALQLFRQLGYSIY